MNEHVWAYYAYLRWIVGSLSADDYADKVTNELLVEIAYDEQIAK